MVVRIEDIAGKKLVINKVKVKGHPCTSTEALYRPYGPYRE